MKIYYLKILKKIYLKIFNNIKVNPYFHIRFVPNVILVTWSLIN